MLDRENMTVWTILIKNAWNGRWKSYETMIGNWAPFGTRGYSAKKTSYGKPNAHVYCKENEVSFRQYQVGLFSMNLWERETC